MAGLEWAVNIDIRELLELHKQFPNLGARMFAFIGKQGRLTLKRELLSGQALNLKGGDAPVDRIGRHMISHSVTKGAKGVSWGAYPLNLFEFGRRLRSGRKEPGQRILTGKFKALALANLDRWVREGEQKIINGTLEKI